MSLLLFKRPKIISYITLFFAMHTLWIYSMKQNDSLVFGGDMFSTVAALIATIALFITYFQNPQIGKPFWLLLALGSGSFFIGDLIRFYHECILDHNVPFPSNRDVFLMLQSIVTLTALFYLFFKHKGYYQFITLIFDIILLIIVIGTISWVYVISPILSLQELTPVMLLITFSYPIIDLLLIIMLIGIYVGFETVIIRRDLIFLFIGVLIKFIADSIYLILLFTDHYDSGNPVDSLYTLAILLIGFTGWLGIPNTANQAAHPTTTNKWLNSRVHLLRPFIPYISVIILITVILFEAKHLNLLQIGAFIAVMLVLSRQIGFIIENNNLLVQSQQRTNELAINEEKYKSLFYYHPDGVFSLDLQENLISCNQPWGNLVGTPTFEMIGKPFLEIFSDCDSRYVFSNHFSKTRKGRTERYELSFINHQGRLCHVQFTNIPIFVKNEIVGIYGIGKDITENKQNEEKIKQMALHDSLTGLPNRILFSEIIQVALADAERNREMLAIMLLDLDRFKTINDTFGHDIGDQLLKQTAERLQASLRKNDTVCRQGGDEFSILLKGINRIEDVNVIAAKILRSLGKPYFIKENEIITTPSIGIAVYPNDGDTTAALLQKADFAMYSVKEHGRNHYRVYSKEKHVDFSKQYLLENDLHQALAKNELILFYQPQFDIPTGKIIGVEALLRWQHPEHGMVSPLDFIPIAEENGSILPIGEWVLNTACRQVKQWHIKGFPLKMAVNLSPRQFRQHNLIKIVKNILNAYSLEPRYLDLEITERIAMKDSQSSIERLNQLKNIGVSISIDDFGTGYSSLSYLANFPIDTLKIAQEFTQKIGQDAGTEAIISSIIGLAHNLHFNVLAEGVEKSFQLQFLKDRNCNQVQGFMFGAPISAHELENNYLLKHEIHHERS
ncbi:DUF4084 domain-containing protein [Bacillus sp. DNRA2]|uniref:DUF4084 domain-containing protein n=1 Tax=Bacillus sp. DNRA2 TaxID=2723053 RepID=UPI00145C618E|nr:DUF4084 domain-containing protein [Bacillus sp. DNRA2]NMD69186.1 DUF4084 domain-containing protein [Bacillus sp. DNRA2]